MCGIVGFVNAGRIRSSLNSKETMNRMLNRIIHRGPDEMGLYLTDQCCMGSVRLSIIDLSGGQQPLCNEDGNLWIAYNGEVFNYPELREDLIKRGHRLKTNCDTEVVLHMYEEFGKDCLSKLNGQFAFSIWDEKRQSLFMARDRTGIRPLFYSQFDNHFIYASELKSLLEFPSFRPSLNIKGLKQILTFWTTLTPETVFNNVFEVPPGHYLIYESGKLTIKSYWELSFNRQERFAGTIEEAGEEFSSLFKDAIRLRLRSDVQVAAYLSGGLDSSVTTSYINMVQPEALNTFAIGFQEKDFDESIYQKEVARYFNTRHASVTCNNLDIPELLEKAVWHAETPLLRTSPIPMMKLSQLVHENGIKVVITGEGADENLGGYNVFKEAIIRQFWAKEPDSRLRPLLLRKLYPYIPQLRNAPPGMLKMFFGYQLEKTDSPVYSHLLRWKNSTGLLGHLSANLKDELKDYDPVKEYADLVNNKLSDYTSLNKAQYIESTIFMSGYLLSSQGDRVAMANSVEGRYPFLDHRIIEFCASLPDDYKIKGLNEKYLLKKLMKGRLPDSVVSRHKQAYRAPVANAFKVANNGLVDHYLDEIEILKNGVFDSTTVGRLVSKLKNGNLISEVDNMALIGLLSTQILINQFINDYQPLTQSSITEGVVRNQ